MWVHACLRVSLCVYNLREIEENDVTEDRNSSPISDVKDDQWNPLREPLCRHCVLCAPYAVVQGTVFTCSICLQQLSFADTPMLYVNLTV